MLDNLENLSRLSGVSGRETAVRNHIISLISEYADEVTTDNAGSIIALKRGARESEERIMILAHMDESGLIITHICEDGLLKFETVGKTDAGSLCGKTVIVGEGKIPGVVGVTPLHLCSSEERSRYPAAEGMYIDIGASSAQEAEMAVSPGDVCVFDTSFEIFGEGKIKGRAVDGRAGCAVLIELMKQEYMTDVYFVFAAAENTGHRGAACAAFSVEPHYAIVINSVCAADIPSVAEDSKICRLGGGAVFSFMDKRTVYDRELLVRAQELCKQNDIKFQIKQTFTEGSEAGIIQTSRAGVRVFPVGLPCRYMHSPAAMIAESDLKDVLRIVYEMTTTLCL